MNIVSGTASPARVSDAPDRERLLDAMQQLEGVFVQELFKAMRETVPDDGIVSGGSGEDIFTSLLDERLASLVPAAWEHDGLEAALQRQFRLAPESGAAARDSGSTPPPSASNGTGSVA